VLELYRSVVEAYHRMGLVTKVLVVLVLFAVTTMMGVALVVLLPADHFSRIDVQPSWWRQHPVLRWTGLILKNGAGFVVLILGGVMVVPGVPGPGLVFIVVGMSLLDFPWKRRLERRLLSFPNVRRFINDVRKRFGRPPLIFE